MHNEEMEQSWQMFLTNAKESGDVSTDTFDLLSNSKISGWDREEGFIEVCPKDEMGYQYLKNNLGNSIGAISEYFCNFHGIKDIKIKSPYPNSVQGGEPANGVSLSSFENEKKQVSIGWLNSRYTFDSFVVGESNYFAHAAATGTQVSPGKHNPLFIRGSSGLGKTHLMNAIGNKMLEKYPGHRICCLSSEEFTNLVVECLSNRNMESLRRKLRDNCDLFMVDDIQFIEGKRSTQEEFFHTFNALYDAGKQIVLTSDREPDEMVSFEDRMTSRFLWGLIVDIKPPDIETRAAIIKKKAEERNVEIPQGVVTMISEKVKNNVRELEGVLTKLVVFAEAKKRPIDIRTALEVLASRSSSMGEGKGEMGGESSAEVIKAMVETFFSLKKGHIESKQRTKNITFARQLAMFLIKKHLDTSYVAIGNMFGKRDHSTVMHSVSKIEESIKQNDKVVISVIEEIEYRMKHN